MSSSVLVALDLAISLMTRGLQISQLVKSAQAAGRTDFTPEEWAVITGEDDAARQRLVDAIEGRNPDEPGA